MMREKLLREPVPKALSGRAQYRLRRGLRELAELFVRRGADAKVSAPPLRRF
jgi:hypothetical protein